MIKKILFTVFLSFINFIVLAQNIGDYRSNVSSGSWNSRLSWQYYNGSSWVTPSGISPQGYPGQYVGTGTVTIGNLNTITISNSTPNAFSSLIVGGGTSGVLVIGADIDILTTNVVINTSGLITFSGNNEVRFPINTGIKIYSPGKIDDQGTCNNNVAVYIGAVKYAVCKGSGNAEFTFNDVNTNGGTLYSTPTSNAIVCQNNSIYLFGNYSGVIGTTVIYSWLIKDPNNNSITTSTQNPIIANPIVGTYTATLTCTTSYSGNSFSNSRTISIGVTPVPVIITQPINQLDCEESIVNFKVVASGSGLSYVWYRKRPSDISFGAIPVETNVTYPAAGEIRLQNVGSSLSPNGTQYQVVVSNGTCSVASSIATLSVNEITNITSPSLTPSQSVMDVMLCYGANYSYTAAISNPSNGIVSYQWKSSVASGTWNNVIDGVHFSGATTATLNIINGTPAESAKYRVDIIYTRTGGNCSVSSFSRIRLLTFLPLLLIPETEVVQPSCKLATGTITVTVQSTTDSYSFDNGGTYQLSNVKSGLVAGSYNIIIKNKWGCLSPIKNSVLIGSVESTWNGTVWLPRQPTSLDKIVFDGNYFSAGDLTGCSCQVNSGNIVINSGNNLILVNELVVLGGALTFENNASLIQINDVVNSGNITYKRQTTPISNLDYVYWSSPVSPQTLFDVSPNTLGDKFYSFDAIEDDWKQESSLTIMDKGIGYIIRGPQNFAAPTPPGFFQASFKGVPNNGAINLPISTTIESSYLLGNPYPSALDADIFLSFNASVLEGTIYFWTHNTAIQSRDNILDTAGTGAYAYTSNDYSSYNRTGGVTAESGGSKPLGKIASGQGFFVTSTNTGILVFNNNMRVGVGTLIGGNSQFFKNVSNSKTTNEIEKHRLWLNFTNKKGAFKQILIGYVKGATNDYDSAYDGGTFDANEFIDFYSIQNDKNLVIQGRALPFQKLDTISLGYRSTVSGEFSISIDQLDGVLESQEVFVEDELLDIIHNLKNEPYVFLTEKGVFDNRLVLRFIGNILDNSDSEILDSHVVVSSRNMEIKINSSAGIIDKVMIYDLLGKKIFEKYDVNNDFLKIMNLMENQQVLLVKTVLESGESVTKKIVY